ncbi:PadR family transcriptional regulator [Clostridium mobile]|nr:PadR family transcriptional regulator [Clostridium mobile]
MADVDNQLKKGVLTILALKLINSKDMYGYELIQLLDDYSSGYYKLKEGSLYPVLYRLEDNGWIESYTVTSLEGRKVPRKYYKITDRGRRELEDQLDSWQRFYSVTNKILDI